MKQLRPLINKQNAKCVRRRAKERQTSATFEINTILWSYFMPRPKFIIRPPKDLDKFKQINWDSLKP